MFPNNMNSVVTAGCFS